MNERITHSENFDGDIILYTVKDIQRIFQCGRTKAYDIMNLRGFPSFKVDTILYVEQTALKKWIEQSKNKRIRT